MKKLLMFLAFTFTYNAFASGDVQYWKEWHEQSKNVSTCSSKKVIAVFLKNAVSDLGNAERTEANAEVIENLVIENPDCFNTSLLRLSKIDCTQVVKFFIDAPIYHDAAVLKSKLQRKCCYAS